MPEPIENAAVDRQSRRYAHTLRRGEPSTPVRIPDVVASSLDALDDQFDVATIAKHKPVRPSEPMRTSEPAPAAESANRTSAPSESTALYRKRSNPSMPTLSADVIARPGAPAASDGLRTSALALPAEDDAAVDDGVSRLPAVVLDPIGSGAVAYPLALRRPPLGLVIAILVAALIVIAVWLL